MKVTGKDFNKLKQLDRIEYRQRERDIKGNGSWELSIFLYKVFTFVGVFYILFLIYVVSSKDLGVVKIMIGSIPYLILMMGVSIAVIYWIDLWAMCKRSFMLKKLKEEYFGVKIKK